MFILNLVRGYMRYVSTYTILCRVTDLQIYRLTDLLF